MVWLTLAFIGGLDFLSFPDTPPVEGSGVSYTRWWAGAAMVRADLSAPPWFGGVRYFDFGEFSFQTDIYRDTPLHFRPYAMEVWAGRGYLLDPHLTFYPALGGYVFSTPEYQLSGAFLHTRFRYEPRVPHPVRRLRPTLWAGVDYIGVNPQAFAELVDLPQIFFARLDLTWASLQVSGIWRSVQAYGNTAWWRGPGVEKGIRLRWVHPRLQIEMEWRDGRELDPWRFSLTLPYGPWRIFYRHVPTRRVEDLFQMGVMYHGRS